MKNKMIFGSLAMDLKRTALGYHRGSDKMAENFFNEAIKRKNEIDKKTTKPYLIKILKNIENIKNEKREIAAENALMYSTIFQNASIS
jgi:hypothetical protein